MLARTHAAYQSLAQGATTTVSVSYGVSDGIATAPASVSWTVTGTTSPQDGNDALMGGYFATYSNPLNLPPDITF